MKITAFNPLIVSKNAQGDKVTDTGTSKATLMFAPSGFTINLVQHIKN